MPGFHLIRSSLMKARILLLSVLISTAAYAESPHGPERSPRAETLQLAPTHVQMIDASHLPAPPANPQASFGPSTIWYVDALATGADNGTSWDDAFNKLEDALAVATSGDEVWVTFLPQYNTPGAATNDRSLSFDLPPGVKLRGGFDGDETDPSQRPPFDKTRLLGDLGAPGIADNAYHVITAFNPTPGTLIDRFYILNGSATGPTAIDRAGGGLLAIGGSLTVRNCLFGSNLARQGGGLAAQNCDVTLESDEPVLGLSFFNCYAVNVGGNPGLGGAIWLFSTDGVQGSLTALTDNSAFLDANFCSAAAGGGIYTYGVSIDASGADSEQARLQGCIAPEEPDGTQGAGGGIVTEGPYPVTIEGLWIDDCTARLGGGLLALAPTTVKGCRFDTCASVPPIVSAVGDIGGGIYAIAPLQIMAGSDGSPTEITDCASPIAAGIYAEFTTLDITDAVFTANVGTEEGGGVYATTCTVTIADSLFDSNESGRGGGVQLVDGVGTSTISDTDFISNSAVGTGSFSGTGAGIRSDTNNLEVLRCNFDGNIGMGDGAAVYHIVSPDMLVQDCRFSNNDAQTLSDPADGGAIYLNPGVGDIINCLFDHNAAERHGGAIATFNSAPALTNVTIADNTAGGTGGGIYYSVPDASMSLRNSIIRSNVDAAAGTATDQTGGSGLYTHIHSNVQDGPIPGIAGNIDADAMFVNPSIGDYRLTCGSPSIDAGHNFYVPAGVTTDLLGDPRFLDDIFTPDTGDGTAPIVDMGPYETPVATIYAVPGAYPNIQAAVDAASNGCVIELADGLYTGASLNTGINLAGKNLTIRSASGNPAACTIMGMFLDRAFVATSGEVARFEGITVSACRNPDGNVGGAILLSGEITIDNCVFTNCFVSDTTATPGIAFGGAIAMFEPGSLTITNSQFIGCGAGDLAGNPFAGDRGIGGAVFADGSGSLSVSISGCTFSENECGAPADTAQGAAMQVNNTILEVSDTIISMNVADFGGAVYLANSAVATFVDCTLGSNQANVNGGAMIINGSTLHADRCTVANNVALNAISGFFFANPPTSGLPGSITNSVFRNNSAGLRGAIYSQSIPTNPLLITNTTIINNSSDTPGDTAGIRVLDAGFDVRNSIVYFNEADGVQDEPAQYTIAGAGFGTFEYSNVQALNPGLIGVDGNISEDPLLSAVGEIQVGSPCIDAGDSTAVPVGLTEDRNGNPRIVDAVNYADTGVPDGMGNVVDMGAYEADANTPAPPCPGDANGDQMVNINDLNLVIGNFGNSGAPGIPGDVNNDGNVNINDLNLVLGNFGTSCL